MQLRGGNVIGIRTSDGKVTQNEDGSPLTFLIEDEKGEVHELFMSIGRMGTYPMFTLPPFNAEDVFDSVTSRSGEKELDGVPLAKVKKKTAAA